MNVRQKTQKTPRVEPLMGNEAIARGAWEGGVGVAVAYPGTPSTEVLEAMGRFPEEDVRAEWAANEKTAIDIAIGASFAGRRAMCAMKHVGLNVASDSLMSKSYIGVNGGLVLVVADDPGMHSSQNEQDTRLFARFANVPVLEPADAQEALEYTRAAFEISERFDTPVIVRSTTRLSHTRSPVRLGRRRPPPERTFIDDYRKNVTLPAHARAHRPAVIAREEKVGKYFDASPFTRVEEGEGKTGVVTVGMAYSYVKEVLPSAPVLKLASSFPLPKETLRAFAAGCERLIVVEELEPLIEEQLKVMGIACEGKEFFPRAGELTPEIVRRGFEEAGLISAKRKRKPAEPEIVPRPPLLCPGCPHTSSFMALRAVDARVCGDIGCYTLAAIEPLRAMDTCVAMGASIGNAVGLALAGTEKKPIVATIGDSTFLHSGIPPLIDAVYMNADITVIILDNHITAMTGGQDNAATGVNLRGQPAPRVDFAEICRAVGVKWIREVDSYDLGLLYQTVRESTEHRGVSVIISNRPCVIDPARIRGEALEVDEDACVACQSCMNLGCPAISWTEAMFDGHHKVKIDPVLCIGCTLCAQVCPAGAINPPAGKKK